MKTVDLFVDAAVYPLVSNALVMKLLVPLIVGKPH